MKKDKRKNKNGSKSMRGRMSRAGSKRSAHGGRKFALTASGRIDANANGFAFLIRDDMGKDAFISADSLGGAIDGDKVIAKLRQKENGGFEAVVVEITEPCEPTLIGTFVNKGVGRGSFVIANDNKINQNINVEKKCSMEAPNGAKVLIKLNAGRDVLSGKITRVFEPNENVDWDVLSVMLAHNLSQDFPAPVLKETARISETIDEEEISSRQDFRNSMTVTIDGDDSRDFDDAIGLEKKGEGFRLCVHIADVAHYVTSGSALDKEAFRRGTSVYFPASFISMLPEKICNNVCSLMENHDRLTLSVVMDINAGGKVTKHKITNGVIRSAHRMTYRNVQKILDGDNELIAKFHDVAPMLEDMKELALILNRRRLSRGSVDFDLPESAIILDEEGKVVDVRRAPRLLSHRIIEEFMLITNETVAEHMQKIEAPFVYRGHLPPTPLKLEAFEDFLRAMSVSWERGEDVVPMDYSKLLSNLPQNLTSIVNMMALRSMTKAAYFPQNKGHFGLASEFYCHFTAPIRRYPDLIIHRIIKDYLKNGKKCFAKYSEITNDASNQSSLTERQADEAEREVDDIYKARFMAEKIGESFEGVISGVAEWGVYVQLENTVEGLVKKESLPGGDYFFNPVIMSLSNMTNIYKPGDSMKITVSSVSKNKIDFIPAIK